MKNKNYRILLFSALLIITQTTLSRSVAWYYQESGPIVTAIKKGNFNEARQQLANYKADSRIRRRGSGQIVGKHQQHIDRLEQMLMQAHDTELKERRRVAEELPFAHAEIEEAEARGARRAARAARKEATELVQEHPISRYTIGHYEEITRAAEDVARIEKREAEVTVERAIQEEEEEVDVAHEALARIFPEITEETIPENITEILEEELASIEKEAVEEEVLEEDIARILGTQFEEFEEGEDLGELSEEELEAILAGELPEEF